MHLDTPIATQGDATRVLYDAGCSLCCDLAQLVVRRGAGRIGAQSWQDYAAAHPTYAATPADRLRVLAGGELHEGDAAWRWLLASHPDVAGLSWMAERLGLAQPVARALGGAADLLRRLCPRCNKHKSVL